MTQLNIPDAEYMYSGHVGCPGCGATIAMKFALKALGEKTIMVIPACCWGVIAGPYPQSSLKVPILQTAFATAGAAASGLKAALDMKGDAETTVVAWAGDGGTFDIGIQALSGAVERNEDFIYVCYDNEAYMNTGVQRSGTTPQGVITTTTPIRGKLQKKKEVPAIIAAHGIGYVATASAAYPLDLYDKIKKAKTMSGPKYIHVHTPCPAGWGFDPRYTVKIGKLAVETGLYDIYEIEQGEFRLTGPSKKLDNSKRKPVSEYFKTQSRFRALSDERIQEIQASIDTKWEEYQKESE